MYSVVRKVVIEEWLAVSSYSVGISVLNKRQQNYDFIVILFLLLFCHRFKKCGYFPLNRFISKIKLVLAKN
jgi:hypothetical protein